MSDPLSNIQPLIPLPPSTVQPNSGELVDKFASLFSPPTPRATPTGSPRPDPPAHFPKHARQESDDFGSFVSVPSTQAPLVANGGSRQAPWSFFEEAKARDSKKRQSLLAEMDRPLFADAEPTSVSLIDDTFGPLQNTDSPKPTTNQLVDAPEQIEGPVSESFHSSPRPAPTRSPTLSMASRPPTLAPPLASTSSVSSLDAAASSEDLTRSTSSLDFGRHSRSYTDFAQSPSISKRRSSQSHSAPPPLTSYSTLSALSAKWMSSILATPGPSQPPATTSTEHHTSPFAPKQPYSPPSGAPGYQGDREGWDKDGRWYGALERDLAIKSSPSSSRSPIPAFVASSSTPSRSSTPPVPRTMGSLLTTALPPPKLSGLMPTTTPIMTTDLASALRAHLPPLRRLRDTWPLLYSLDQHGVSLGTLYSRCDRIGSGQTQTKRVGEFASAKDEFGIMGTAGGAAFGSSTGGLTTTTGELGTVFVVQDANGGVFGAWLGERLRAGEGGYFGTGESFLWRQVSPTDVEVFKWTGKNDYVALCETDYISFGGGDGSYGLYLDSSLFEGSSAKCPTFDNSPLCDGIGQKGMRKFECVGLEVWGV